MAKTKSSNGGFITGAAEMIGGALGTLAGKVNRLRSADPPPAEDAKKPLAAAATTRKIPKPAKRASPKAVKRGKNVVKRTGKTAATRRARAPRKD